MVIENKEETRQLTALKPAKLEPRLTLCCLHFWIQCYQPMLKHRRRKLSASEHTRGSGELFCLQTKLG